MVVDVHDLTLVQGFCYRSAGGDSVLPSTVTNGHDDDATDANSARRRYTEVEGQLLTSLSLVALFSCLRSSSPSLSVSPSSSRILAGRRTSSRKDERSRGPRLLHHVPVVSAVPEGPDVDHRQPGSARGVRVRLQGRQATGSRAARMGRLSGQIPGKIQCDLRGEKVLKCSNRSFPRFYTFLHYPFAVIYSNYE